MSQCTKCLILFRFFYLAGCDSGSLLYCAVNISLVCYSSMFVITTYSYFYIFIKYDGFSDSYYLAYFMYVLVFFDSCLFMCNIGRINIQLLVIFNVCMIF